MDAGQPTFWRLTLDALDQLRVGRDSEIGRALQKARRIDSPALAPPLDQVFGWLQAEYSNSAVERVVADILKRRPNSLSAHHDAILRLSCRFVMTPGPRNCRAFSLICGPMCWPWNLKVWACSSHIVSR